MPSRAEIKQKKFSTLLLKKNIDILLITETCLAQHGDDVIIQNLTPLNFICKSFPRPSHGGGIAIIYKNILERKLQIELNFSFDHTSFEAAEFSIDQGYNFFQVICIYRPPYSGSNKLSVTSTHNAHVTVHDTDVEQTNDSTQKTKGKNYKQVIA